MKTWLAALAVLACVLAGCGIPTQSDPTLIEPTSVPFGLLDAHHQAPEATSAQPEKTPAIVYFVKAKTLLGVQRGIGKGPIARQAEAVLRALTAGPDKDEQARGLNTTVPPSLHLTVGGYHDGRITIDITTDPSGVTAAESPLTVAQIVLSVTSLQAVDEVQLTRDKQPIEAPVADGSLTSAPLTAKDYDMLRISRPQNR